jgi:hypothetical protein
MRRSAGWYEPRRRGHRGAGLHRSGHTERAATLRVEAAAVTDLLGDV